MPLWSLKGMRTRVATGQADAGGQPRTFGADGAFGDLDHDFAAWGIEVGDVLLGDASLRFPAFGAAVYGLNARVERGRHDVPVVEEAVLLAADVHEGGFETVFQVLDAALENGADKAFLGGALNGEFLQLIVLHHRNASLQGLGVDDDVLVGDHTPSNEFLHEVGSDALDVRNAACKEVLLLGRGLLRLMMLRLSRLMPALLLLAVVAAAVVVVLDHS